MLLSVLLQSLCKETCLQLTCSWTDNGLYRSSCSLLPLHSKFLTCSKWQSSPSWLNFDSEVLKLVALSNSTGVVQLVALSTQQRCETWGYFLSCSNWQCSSPTEECILVSRRF